jgi:hypothetical protein
MTDRISVNDIETASFDGPTRLTLHTPEGYGKTTLAAYFPRPVFLAPENGFPRDLPFRPKRFPLLREWKHALQAVDSLTYDEHAYETLVIDTVDWLEPLLHDYVCERDSGRKTELNKGGNKLESIEDYGYGKGYVAAREEFQRLLYAIDLMQARHLENRRLMHCVLLMHSKTVLFENPSGPNYKRWEPKVDSRIARLVIEWSENVLFGFYEVEAGKLKDEKEKHAKGVSTGKRLLGTRHNALYDAKNRMGLPEIMELGEPDDMIPCLLGEHLANQEPATRKPTDRGGKKATGDVPKPREDRRRERTSEPERRTEPARRSDRPDESQASDQRALRETADRVAANDYPEAPSTDRSIRMAPGDGREPEDRGGYRPLPDGADGHPAHHESRRDDETQRAQKALDRAAGRDAGGVDFARRTAEHRAAKEREAPRDPHPTREVNTDLMKRLTDALARAKAFAQANDNTYDQQVDDWVRRAGSDESRIESIINRVNRDTAAPAA